MITEVMSMRISLNMVTISQCISISNHQIVHLKYIQFLMVRYSSKQRNYIWLIVVNILLGDTSWGNTLQSL